MRIIVNAGANWGIGLKNKLLVRIPNDMKFFSLPDHWKGNRDGAKYFGELSAVAALAGRTNIVLTTDPAYMVKGAIILHSMEELFEELKKYNDDDVYVVGGESIYRQLLPYCNKAYVTKVNHSYEADAYFPNLDELPEWRQTGESEEQTYFDLEYVFATYERQ